MIFAKICHFLKKIPSHSSLFPTNLFIFFSAVFLVFLPVFLVLPLLAFPENLSLYKPVLLLIPTDPKSVESFQLFPEFLLFFLTLCFSRVSSSRRGSECVKSIKIQFPILVKDKVLILDERLPSPKDFLGTLLFFLSPQSITSPIMFQYLLQLTNTCNFHHKIPPLFLLL